MPECTPEERLIDPCWCSFIDCLLEVAAEGHHCRDEIVQLRLADKIDTDQALNQLKICKKIEDLGSQDCSDDYVRCSGKEQPGPQPGSPFSKEEKEELRRTFDHTIRAYSRVAAVACFMSNMPGVNRPTRLIGKAGKTMGIAMAGMGRIAHTIDEMADDPPDANFTVIPRATPAKIPPVQADADINEDAALALNAYMKHIIWMAAYSKAMSTAINRSQGAFIAGDFQSQQRQLKAARKFASKWADELARSRPRRSAVIEHLPDLAGFSLDIADAIEIRMQIVTSGWPKFLRDAASKFGLRGLARKRLLNKLRLQLFDLQPLTARFQKILINPEITSQEQALTSQLHAFSQA